MSSSAAATAVPRPVAESLAEIRGLVKHFPIRRGLLQRTVGVVRALDGVDLVVRPGECLALVGESGSGKTTLGRCLLRLEEPTAGRVSFRGEDLLALAPAALRRRRRHFQMIFQDPYGSLNPRMRVGRIISEPLEVHGLAPGVERRRRVRELLRLVGLPEEAEGRYPHEFSGGQRQRVGIARALATEPELLVADEPVSALDVSVRAQIVNLLMELQERLGLALLFIAHDLALVEQIADRVVVLYLGKVAEEGSTAELFARPRHPYTVSLLSAVPVPDPEGGRERIVLPGELPSPASPPAGCPFHPRCPIARERCSVEVPALSTTVVEGAAGVDGAGREAAEPGHRVACHYPGELRRAGTA